jgi:hypothetical protein
MQAVEVLSLNRSILLVWDQYCKFDQTVAILMQPKSETPPWQTRALSYIATHRDRGSIADKAGKEVPDIPLSPSCQNQPSLPPVCMPQFNVPSQKSICNPPTHSNNLTAHVPIYPYTMVQANIITGLLCKEFRGERKREGEGEGEGGE